jgi:hypothetical protein
MDHGILDTQLYNSEEDRKKVREEKARQARLEAIQVIQYYVN